MYLELLVISVEKKKNIKSVFFYFRESNWLVKRAISRGENRNAKIRDAYIKAFSLSSNYKRKAHCIAINGHVHFHLRYAPANREAKLRRHTPLISHRGKDRRVNSVDVTVTNALCSSWTEKKEEKFLSILSMSIYDNGDRTCRTVAPFIFISLDLRPEPRHFVGDKVYLESGNTESKSLCVCTLREDNFK